MSARSPRIPRWSELRPVGNSWAARLTVLIPLVGYLILFNATLAQYVGLIGELGGRAPEHFSLSVSPRLFLVYFGLCFIAAGSAVYSWRCPRTIKRFASGPEFAGGDGAHMGEFAQDLIEAAVRSKPEGEEFIAFSTRMSHRVDESFSPQEALAESKNAALHVYYGIENNERLFARAISTLFFSIGFVLLAVPSLQIFMRVATILWDVVSTHGLRAFWPS